MITQDFINGYVSALNNILSALETMYKKEPDYQHDTKEGFYRSIEYVKEVKDNYKKLVKDLNKK